MKQTNDHNCGSAAIIYFCRLNGITAPILENIDGVSLLTRCEPKRGTKPVEIKKFVASLLPVRSQYHTPEPQAPSIVLYLSDPKDEESGHYAVVTQIKGRVVFVFDPWTGSVIRWNRKYFESVWRCHWYGDRWMLTAKRP